MNQRIFADRNKVTYAAWGIVLLTLAHLCWLQRKPESELHCLRALATRSSADHTAAPAEDRYDWIAEQTGDGNVLLKLAGYAATNPAVENSLGYLYFRAGYELYPRRIYAAPNDEVINNGRDIMRADFNPDGDWLREHHVQWELIFGNNHAAGEPPLLKSLSADGNGLAAPSDSSGGK